MLTLGDLCQEFVEGYRWLRMFSENRQNLQYLQLS